MAYRLSTGDEPVSHQIHRIFLQEIDSAINHLTKATPDDRDRRVHEARKSIKKIRALLRLVAGHLGRRGFRIENRRFRDIGRTLSDLRDAQAIIESFAALPEGTVSVALRTKLQKRLEVAKANTYSSLNVEQVLQSAVAALQDARPHLESFAMEDSGFSSIEPGFLNIYRQGRKALKAARKTGSPENLHNFRKRVKDHWYHTRLLGETPIALLDGRQDALRQLETHLGESHNLHVLHQTLKAGKPAKSFLAALRSRESELGVQALALAGQLYDLKPRQLKDELSGVTKIWKKDRKQSRIAEPKAPVREDTASRKAAAIA